MRVLFESRKYTVKSDACEFTIVLRQAKLNSAIKHDVWMVKDVAEKTLDGYKPLVVGVQNGLVEEIKAVVTDYAKGQKQSN